MREPTSESLDEAVGLRTEEGIAGGDKRSEVVVDLLEIGKVFLLLCNFESKKALFGIFSSVGLAVEVDHGDIDETDPGVIGNVGLLLVLKNIRGKLRLLKGSDSIAGGFVSFSI